MVITTGKKDGAGGTLSGAKLLNRMHVNTADSRSLWNYTLSPGWTREEADLLRLALMKFGIGSWTRIIDSSVLPGKSVAQLNLQTQRLLGQQSTAEFMGLHIDPHKIMEVNKTKTDAKRKNGMIINSGPNPTKERTRMKREENERLFGIPKEEYDLIELKAVEAEKTSNPLISLYMGSALTPEEREEHEATLVKLKARLAKLEAKLEEKLAEENESEKTNGKSSDATSGKRKRSVSKGRAPKKPKATKKSSAKKGAKEPEIESGSEENVNTSPPQNDDDDGVVLCLCGSMGEDGKFMIQCEGCLTWQHGPCVGYKTERSVPDAYVCSACAQ